MAVGANTTPTTAVNGSSKISSIATATSVNDLRDALADLARREAAITSSLDALLATQRDLARQLARLDLARAHLGAQVVATRAVSSGMLGTASMTAGRISSAVRQLDREHAAVRSTLEVVDHVAELKACLLGVTGSMGAPQDWETAASYLQRARQVPAAVIDSPFAEEMVPTAEMPEAPRRTLDSASESLCGLFLREFDKAARDGDGARVTRFFKLFPLIGRAQVGLDAYGKYVCSGVASRARTTLNSSTGKAQGLFYANALIRLFEHIAQIVDGHEPLVERHYGTGSMTKVVERIQMEADVQGGIVLDTWVEERRVARRLTDVKSYPFNFLVQSFRPTTKAALSSTPRTASPALGHTTTPAGTTAEDDAVDMKEVDALLTESATMLGRWALYTRFLASKTVPAADGEKLQMPSFIANSSLAKKTSDHLMDPFTVLATFFFRRSVEKAFQLDEQPTDLTLNPNKTLSSNPPFITSAVDDTMYILNQVLQRTLSTRQRAVVGGVVPSIGRVLGGDFFGMIQRRMRDECYPKAAVQGALPPEGTIVSFLVLMNNLDVATSYVKRVVRSALGNDPLATLTESFPFGNDASFVEKTLRNMEAGFDAKTFELLHEAVEVMLKQVMRPRLRPVLADAFRDADYLIEPGEDHGDDGHEPGESVAERFERGWHAFTMPIKRIATPDVYDKLLATTAAYLASTLEKRIWAYFERVTALGAVRLERDIAGIVAAAVKGGKYELRDLFARCVQMALVMNMERDEWEQVAALRGRDLELETGVQWKLDEAERRRARALVVD